jgi:hypothetical protein
MYFDEDTVPWLYAQDSGLADWSIYLLNALIRIMDIGSVWFGVTNV